MELFEYEVTTRVIWERNEERNFGVKNDRYLGKKPLFGYEIRKLYLGMK